MGKSPNEVKKFLALLTGQNDELKEVSDGCKNLSIMGLYELLISRDIESVLLDAFRPLVRDLFKKYIFEATIYMNNQRGYPDDNLPKREPDIAFLKRIESAKYGMGSLEEVALKWRAEIVNHREVCLKKGEMFDFDTDITLKQAVESVFIEDHRDNVWGLMIENPEDSEKDRRAKKARKNKFLKELKARDYCDCCLEEAVDHYSSMAVRPSYEHIFFDFDPSASDI